MPNLMLAGCVILASDGGLLLIHRNTPTRTQWELPGGKVEADEDPHQTATRELKEELGISVTIVRELGRADFTEDGHVLTYIWFLADYDRGDRRPRLMEPDKYDRLDHFTPEAVLDAGLAPELSPNARNLMDAVRAGKISLS